MKYLSSFIAISVLVCMSADAAAPMRARPGSISGAFMSKSTASSSAGQTSVSSVHYSPITNNRLTQITLENGQIGYLDAINGDRFEFDRDGNLSKLDLDPDDTIIANLGVDIKTARAACQSISADSHQAVFDEENYECLIPVVAHNWSGVIQKDDKDVVAWTAMGSPLKCSANSFENVRALRRSSQWVVPVMVVGGTGIGAGVGAAIDKKQEEKIEKLKDDLVNASGKASGSIGTDVIVDVNAVPFGGKVYNLKNDAERAALINALGLSTTPTAGSGGGNGDLPNGVNDIINQYYEKLAECIKLNFKEMVSTYVSGQPKIGRIKISTDSNRGCETANTANKAYCHYDVVHKTTAEWADCEPNEARRDAYFANGGCYYRDESSTTYGPRNKNNDESYDTVSAFEDTTASFDKHRFDVINWYRNLNILADGQKTNLQNKLLKFEMNTGTSSRSLDVMSKASFNNSQSYNEQYAANGEMNYFLMWGNDGVKFGDIVPAGYSPVCELESPEYANTVEKLNQAYVAITALQQVGAGGGAGGGSGASSVNTAMLDNLLKNLQTTINVNADFMAKMGINAKLDETLGKDRKFMDTALGKGTVIGASVGTAAGLGYWFAEGASVFCNVGGIQQVKLNKTFSVPTFREYIIDHKYIK